MIIVNFKTYESGSHVLAIAKALQKVDPKIIIAAQSTDIFTLTQNTKITVYAQHIDPKEPGRNTGYVLPQAVKSVGAKGTLLNHSEHPMNSKEIGMAIQYCRKEGLKTICCAKDLHEAAIIKKFAPDAIAFEDPKLVATKKSISTYDSAEIKEFVSLLKGTSIIPLCGAGISTHEDVVSAKRLGCRGILISSAIVTAKNPAKALQELQ